MLPTSSTSLSSIDNTTQDKDVDVKDIPMILDQTDKWGNTVLHTAAASGYHKLVQLFLDVGANNEKKNMFHLTPFDVASNEICRSLLELPTVETKNTEEMAKVMLG